MHTQHTRVFIRKEAIPGLSLHCSPHPHLSSAAGSSPLTVTPSSTRRAELRLRDLDSYVCLQNPSVSACAHRQACACPRKCAETLGSLSVRTTEVPALPCPRCPEQTRWNRHQKQGQLQAGGRGTVSPQPEEEGLVLGSPRPLVSSDRGLRRNVLKGPVRSKAAGCPEPPAPHDLQSRRLCGGRAVGWDGPPPGPQLLSGQEGPRSPRGSS